MTDVADIAKGLSKAQQRAIVSARSRGRNVTTGEPAFWRSYATAPTARRLAKYGDDLCEGWCDGGTGFGFEDCEGCAARAYLTKGME